MRGVGGTKASTDAGANVPVGAVSRVAQPCHQVRERRCGPPELPPGLPYQSAEAGQRWDHEVEGVLGIAPVRPGITQWADQVRELHYRRRVPMGDQQRQRIRFGRADVQVVDRLPVDFGDELRDFVEASLLSPPIEPVAPVVGQLLEVGQGTPREVVRVSGAGSGQRVASRRR